MALDSTTFPVANESNFTPDMRGDWNFERLRLFAEKVAAVKGLVVTEINHAGFDHGKKLHFDKCPICRTTNGNAELWMKNGKPYFKCFETHDPPDPNFADLEKLLGALPVPTLDFLSWHDLVERYSKRPETLIEGLLRRGDTAGFIGSTKSRKTWMIIGLAVALAIGRNWLKFEIKKPCRVLVVDNELQISDLLWRYTVVCESMGIDPKQLDGLVTFLPLRGKLMDIESLSKELEAIGAGKHDVVILDSLYKFFPQGFSENDNAAMTKLLCIADKISLDLKAAVIFTHHQSKGRQDSKTTTDVGSGAGALSRSTDLHFVCRADTAADTLVVSMAARSQPPVEDFLIRWSYPLFSMVDGTPHLSDGQRVQLSIEQVIAELPLTPIHYDTFVQRIHDKTGGTKTQIKERLQAAIEQKLVIKADRKSNEKQMIYRAADACAANLPPVAVPRNSDHCASSFSVSA
jgi:hypothetical protein